jgi:hypothetical protein
MRCGYMWSGYMAASSEVSATGNASADVPDVLR